VVKWNTPAALGVPARLTLNVVGGTKLSVNVELLQSPNVKANKSAYELF